RPEHLMRRDRQTAALPVTAELPRVTSGAARQPPGLGARIVSVDRQVRDVQRWEQRPLDRVGPRERPFERRCSNFHVRAVTDREHILAGPTVLTLHYWRDIAGLKRRDLERAGTRRGGRRVVTSSVRAGRDGSWDQCGVTGRLCHPR